MAHSRPPPLRSSTVAVSPPPRSPRTPAEKNSRPANPRRRSGNYTVHAEKRGSSRPAPVTRKTTSHIASGGSRARATKDREYESERDSGESFPQFCMTCEKQFLPANNTHLYCSESCRLHDQAPTYPLTTPNSPPLTPYTSAFSSLPGLYSPDDGPDIIPRLSPTQPRPRSYFHDESSYSYQAPPASLPSRHTYSQSQSAAYTSQSSTALASLRELATTLPRPPVSESPPDRLSRTGSGVWNYIPFTKTTTPTATPGNSYVGCGSYAQQPQYGNGRSNPDLFAYGKGMDRPLPPRTNGYGHRPKSIDLVTPYTGAS